MTIFKTFAPKPTRNENRANFIRVWTHLMSLSASTEETTSIATKAIEMLTPTIHINYRNARRISIYSIYMFCCAAIISKLHSLVNFIPDLGFSLSIENVLNEVKDSTFSSGQLRLTEEV